MQYLYVQQTFSKEQLASSWVNPNLISLNLQWLADFLKKVAYFSSPAQTQQRQQAVASLPFFLLLQAAFTKRIIIRARGGCADRKYYSPRLPLPLPPGRHTTSGVFNARVCAPSCFTSLFSLFSPPTHPKVGWRKRVFTSSRGRQAGRHHWLQNPSNQRGKGR